MRILVYGINYAPELIGIGKYTTEMCEWLADHGDEVEVITGMPSYPSWRVFDEYRGRWWFKELKNRVKIWRCPLYVPKKVTGATRILHEISFSISTSFVWLVKLFKHYDVVICIAPPLQLGLAGIMYKLFRRTVVVYHIQDLQLDAAKQLGLIKSRLILTLVEKIERIIFKKSDIVSTISDGMIRKILAKNVPAGKILEFKNWIDTEHMAPMVASQEIKELFDIDAAKKIILYSGNIGEKQGIEIILDVAGSFQDDAIFLIIGDGAFKSRLLEIAVQKGLSNVKFFPLQPIEKLRVILNTADIHLVLQKKAAADLVMPSKLTAILSVGGVAIVSAESGTTLHDIISRYNMGIVIEPENAFALQETIFKNLKLDLSEIRINARKYAENHLDKKSIMSQFQDQLRNQILT